MYSLKFNGHILLILPVKTFSKYGYLLQTQLQRNVRLGVAPTDISSVFNSVSLYPIKEKIGNLINNHVLENLSQRSVEKQWKKYERVGLGSGYGYIQQF